MAMEVKPQQAGIDVGKEELAVSVDGQKPFMLPNAKKEIQRWLKQFSSPAEFALEATNVYHLLFADLAQQKGHKIFLVNGYRLNRYREGIGGRAKTDLTDAALLVRYLKNERENLQPWESPSQEQRRIMGLLQRRATLVETKTRLQQSFNDIKEVRSILESLVRKIDGLDLVIQKKIRSLIQRAGWSEDARRCEAIEGIGPITSMALAAIYHRGKFRSSDAFIAFMGLDVRVRDSGKKRGRRCLTKQGNPELRRLLYLAAMQAKRKPAWQGYYQRCLDRGLAPVQAFNVLARKLARVAFGVMRSQSEYQPKVT